MRGALLLIVLAAGCGRSRAVEVTFVDSFVEPEVTRVEVQIARAPEGGCEALTWTMPLPSALDPVTIGQNRNGTDEVLGDERFGDGDAIVVVARAFDAGCGAIAAGCTEDTAGGDGPLRVNVSVAAFEMYGACVGECMPDGRCVPLTCGEPGACVDGNADPGDGCDADCAVEPGWDCESGVCASYSSCADYFDAGWRDDGLYPFVGIEPMSCDMNTAPGGWTLVAIGLSGGPPVGFDGWSTAGTFGAGAAPWAGAMPVFPGFKLSDATIGAVQGREPAVMVRRIGDLGFVDRFSAPGCRYRHTEPATGACAVMSSTFEPAPDPLPPGVSGVLGAGDGEVVCNDLDVGWRLPAVGASPACDGTDFDCELEIFVR